MGIMASAMGKLLEVDVGVGVGDGRTVSISNINKHN